MRTTPVSGLRKGAWTEEEDVLLKNTIAKYGEGKWHRIPDRAGLNRCRKSCRLRWLNYLKPDIKRGDFSFDEVDLIIRLHKLLGNRWSLIAGRLPGRTANDVKNYWNTHLFKKLLAGRIPGPKQLRPAKNITTTTTTGNNTTRQTETENIHVVVRPKPRYFSKEIRPNVSTGYIPDVPVKDISPPAPAQDPATSVQLDPATSNNSMQYWWDHLFADDDDGHEVAPGLAESRDIDIMSLFSAGSFSPSSECNQEGGHGSSFFPPESEFWDFLFSDN